MDKPLLKVCGLKKSFGGVEVLHSIDFIAEAGKVTALVGENGAGKSTFMKILMGEYDSDAGTIELNGKEVHFTDSHQALSNGISMIFQEMSPFPNLTVAENMYIGREPHKLHFLKKKELREKAKAQLKKLNISLNIDTPVKNLTVSEMQLLEIAKAVSYQSQIVIMDEPTSALTDSEVRILFDMIAKLKKQGVAIIYISHKLDELFEIADVISVLRDGQMISTHPIELVDRDVMISEMVGRKIDNIYPTVEKKIGEPVLEVRNLKRQGIFHNISFHLKKGEILGIAGMVGAGRTEVVTSIFGIDKYQSREIFLNGKKVDIYSPKSAIQNHIALVPEDRARCGLNLGATIRSNMCTTILNKTSKFHGALSDSKAEYNYTRLMMDKMHIKATGSEQEAGSLSGGNQQKIVVGKWLLTEPEIVFLDEPTRGIDVGAKYEIYQLIQKLAKEGKAIIMISSEMPELLGICDRVLVMRNGEIAGEMDVAEATQEKIMSVIVGEQ